VAVVEGGELHRTVDAGTTWQRVDGVAARSVVGHGGSVLIETRGGWMRLARNGTMTSSDGWSAHTSKSMFERADGPAPPALRSRQVEMIAAPARRCSAGQREGNRDDAMPVRIRAMDCAVHALGRSPLARPPGADDASSFAYANERHPLLTRRDDSAAHPPLWLDCLE
jgi:hypothetical protein